MYFIKKDNLFAWTLFQSSTIHVKNERLKTWQLALLLSFFLLFAILYLSLDK